MRVQKPLPGPLHPGLPVILHQAQQVGELVVHRQPSAAGSSGPQPVPGLLPPGAGLCPSQQLPAGWERQRQLTQRSVGILLQRLSKITSVKYPQQNCV